MTTASVSRIGDPTRPSRLIAAEVRAEMGRAGINQTELARRMAVTQAWLSRRIGVGAPVDITFEEALAMGEALGITPERLLTLLLPRLDSNQQPSGYPYTLLSGGLGGPAEVVDLGAERAWRRAS